MIGLGLRKLAKNLEDWWFDITRSVRTSEPAQLRDLTIVGNVENSYMYLPVRVANARTALRDLPVNDLANYTFVDIGSGRGRVLFIAAEFPFRRIVGVEFAAELHQSAIANFRRFRFAKQNCTRLESVNTDARGYRFPDENLVIYLFNPFGPDVLATVLGNLKASLEAHPREAIILLIYPENAFVLQKMPWLTLYKETPRFHIYQARL